jgi:hypothetical protein
MSRTSFAVTIAVLVCTVVALSVFSLQKLFVVSGPANEGSAEATEETTRATQQTTDEPTAYGEETSAYAEEITAYYKEGTTVLQEDVLEAPPDSTLSYGRREVRSSPLLRLAG